MIYIKLFMTFILIPGIFGMISAFFCNEKIGRFCDSAMLFGFVGAGVTVVVFIWDFL